MKNKVALENSWHVLSFFLEWLNTMLKLIKENK
jgi:hypothetical protein